MPWVSLSSLHTLGPQMASQRGSLLMNTWTRPAFQVSVSWYLQGFSFRAVSFSRFWGDILSPVLYFHGCRRLPAYAKPWLRLRCLYSFPSFIDIYCFSLYDEGRWWHLLLSSRYFYYKRCFYRHLLFYFSLRGDIWWFILALRALIIDAAIYHGKGHGRSWRIRLVPISLSGTRGFKPLTLVFEMSVFRFLAFSAKASRMADDIAISKFRLAFVSFAVRLKISHCQPRGRAWHWWHTIGLSRIRWHCTAAMQCCRQSRQPAYSAKIDKPSRFLQIYHYPFLFTLPLIYKIFAPSIFTLLYHAIFECWWK